MAAAFKGIPVAAPTMGSRWDNYGEVVTAPMIGRCSDDKVASPPIVAVAWATSSYPFAEAYPHGRYSDDIATICSIWYKGEMEQMAGGGLAEYQDLTTLKAVSSNVPVKDQMDLMSRCWFSLTANRTDPIEHAFEDRRSKRRETVRITGHQEHGIATIHDQDLLIFAISQLVEANKSGLQASRRIRFTPYQFFAWMNRTPTGSAYQRLRDALQRLRTTTIETTIRSGTNRRDRIKQFSWISEFGTIEENGEMCGVEVVLAEWLFESVQGLNVLTIDKGYFDIAGPVERSIYLYARKATGGETGRWIESFKSLYAKSASQQDFKHYASTLRKLAKKNNLPGIRLESCAGANGAASLLMERTEKRIPMDRPNQEQLLQIEQSPIEEAWENALAHLSGKVGESTANQWFKPLQPVSFESGTLTYRAKTKFIADWVQSRYVGRLCEAWKLTGYEVEKIVIEAPRRKLAA